jgi:diacylglycerol kinase family enzyme
MLSDHKHSMTSQLQASMQQHGHLQHNSSRAHRRCLAIINPAGSNGQLRKKWDRMSPDVHENLSIHGIELEECFTSGPGSAAVLASQAAAAGVDVVLAVGGDGTIHEVRQHGQCFV